MVIGTDRYSLLKGNTKKLKSWNKEKDIKFSLVESKRLEESLVIPNNTPKTVAKIIPKTATNMPLQLLVVFLFLIVSFSILFVKRLNVPKNI